MRKIAFFLSLVVLAMGFIGCTGEKAARLKHELSKVNAKCPVDMGMMGQITGMGYDPDDSVVSMNFSVNEDIADLSVIDENRPVMINSLKLAFAKDDMRLMVERMVEVDASLVMTFKGMTSGKTVSIAMSADELRDILDNRKSTGELNDELMANQIAIENSRCPYEVETGMTMTRVYDDGKDIVYECDVDETIYDISILNEMKDEVKREMKSLFRDPVAMRQIKILSEMGRGMIYRYTGDASRESADISFSPAEISSMAR